MTFTDTSSIDSEPGRAALVPVQTKLENAARDSFLRARGIDPRGPMQLEIWPDDMRAIPNDYARSSVFSARNKKEPREALQGSTLFHVDKSVKVTFTGIELRAYDDELVWLQILEYAKHFPLGEPVEFNLHQLLIDLGWPPNGRNYTGVRESISRLKANEIKVENEKTGRGGGVSLIRDYDYEGGKVEGSRYRVWIHPNLIMVFAGRTYTRVAWAQYRKLTPLARRLYDNIASHKDPFPMTLETFREITKSTCKDPYKWAQMVRAVCKELEASGLVKKIWVAQGRIYAERR